MKHTNEHHGPRSITHQQARQLLSVTQQNDYTWMAVLPELTSMWAMGHSEDEAIEQWLRDYDQPALAPIFAALLLERADHPLVDESSQDQMPIPRPLTAEFSYRGKRYRIQTNDGLPKRHIVLPNGTVLVVCLWHGRVPSALADVRRSAEPLAPEAIASQLDGVLAIEILQAPGQQAQENKVHDLRIRFVLHGDPFLLSHEAYEQHKWIVYVPDHGYYRIGSYLESMPVQLGGLSPLSSDQVDQNGVAVALHLDDAVDVDPWDRAR
ncbi:hypothetical protein KDH_80270 [Dictyobacter sp. S3.2.2.5]|uniref:Uncharacterized protein n=1 Tax=Dictyobacter halimunensis TaxID=3026934 RepID=A0ABQ6G3W7_9CHLR|nr:hypothetical protein KDH_80270 [Dictyobacter sp. S3.2.2.5]